MRMHLTVVLILLCLGNLSWWDSALSRMYSIFCWEFFMSALNLVIISDISDTCMLYLVDRHHGLSTYKWTNTLQPIKACSMTIGGEAVITFYIQNPFNLWWKRFSITIKNLGDIFKTCWTYLETCPFWSNTKFGAHVSVFSKKMDL